LIPILPIAAAVNSIAQDFTNIAEPGFIFLIGWICVWCLMTFRWKSVRLIDSTLEVSNYLRKARIPVSEILSIEGSSFWGWQPQTVRISFKSSTAFGDSIVFVPAGGWLGAESFAASLRNNLGVE
jgi:hypothetical protein